MKLHENFSPEMKNWLRPCYTVTPAESLPLPHRRSQGGKGAMPPPKFLENIVILCFERRFSKQNSVIRQESNILALPQFFCPPNFWTCCATASLLNI